VLVERVHVLGGHGWNRIPQDLLLVPLLGRERSGTR
jgi:hypothetical protein